MTTVINSPGMVITNLALGTGSDYPALYIQEAEPVDATEYFWIQKKVGGKAGAYTLWVNDLDA